MDIDLTFKPVAVELIDNVFPTPITYFRENFSEYDPATGDVTPGYWQYDISAGIIKRERIEQGGIGESYKLTLWIHHADGGFEFLPTTSDFVQYDGVTWKVIQVDPTYSSDGLVASKLVVSTRFGGHSTDATPPTINGPSAVTILNTELEVGTYTADKLVTWTLTGSDAALFTITPVINGTLSFISTPDTRFHFVTVVATDKVGNTSTLDVTVEVIPDTVPPSVSGPTDRTINSNETTVATYTANKTSTWSVGGTDAANFAIDVDGVLTYVGSIQVGSINSIDIEATDVAGNVGTLPVTVTVVDVVPPVITGPSVVGVDEPDQAVANYSANEIVTWSLSGTDAGLFSISTLGVLTFTDPSVHGVYAVTVIATDEVALASSRAVEVTVTDVTPPIITGPSTINVVEGDTVLATYTANEAVVWTLTGAESSLFNIDASGNLTFADPAVFGTYAVVVVATDVGNNFDTVEVTVVVNDVIPPNITGPDTVSVERPDQVVASYTADEDVTWTVGGVDAALFTIAPTAPNAADLTFTDPSTVGSYSPVVTATDQGGNQDLLAVAVTVADTIPPIITGPDTVDIDEPNQTVASYSANESVTWSVGGVDAGLFTITVNGDLSFTNPSVHGTYAVDVIATDTGPNATTLSVAVTVTDVTPPVITGPGTVEVGEPDQAVATYTANEAVTWSITGPDVALFAITQGGELSFIAPSTLGDYSVTVVATDVGSNVTNKGVLVQVVDVTPPIITGPAAPTVERPDQFVAQYLANEAVTWSLSGVDAGLFTIDASGNLSFIAPSTLGTFNVNVVATDTASNAATLAVTVTVSDTIPPIITGPSTVTIYFPEAYVATYTADEPVTWSLTGTDAALLNIDASGVVTVIDTATIRDFSFNVVATDPSTNSSSLAVTVTGLWSPGFATTSLWLDAADAGTITETAGAVSQWDDKSGNARHATQSTPGQEPTYGAVTQNSLNTVTFDGSNDNLDIASTSIFTSGNSDIGIFAAYKPTAAPGSRGAIFGNFSTGNLAVYFGDDAPFVEPWGVYNNADIDLSTDSYVQNGDYIASIVRSDGNFTGWTAGNQNETVANTDSVYAGAGTASTWSIGDTTSGQNASVDLWEFATIDGSISTPERERFEGYLAWKWGLEANLPPTHYWKNEPPNETALTQWSLGINTAGTFTLITNSTCNVDIDWGDGNVDTSVVLIGTTNTDHIYSSAGEYLIKITLNSGDFYPYYNNDVAGDELVTLGDTPAGWSFGTTLQNAFYGSGNLTTVGDIDTSAVTSFQQAWESCTSLTSFPLLDTSSGTSFSLAWSDCTSLTSFPLLDTSSATDFFSAWYKCYNIDNITALGDTYSFPELDMSSVVTFYRAWRECTKLTSFPELPAGKRPVAATKFEQAWYNCSKLETFPANFFDSWTATPSNNCFAHAWGNCPSLTATSVENILNSIDTSGRSAPGVGPDITIDYNAGSGTPDVEGANFVLRNRGWNPLLNGADPSTYTLDQNFAADKSLIDAVSGTQLITFTRASTATYVDAAGVIQTAAIDTPRFDHDPSTLESLGLLIEEERTNFEPNSNFPVSSNSNSTITDVSGIVTPDGQVSTVKRHSFAFKAWDRFGLLSTGTAGTVYTGSVYIRSVTGTTTIQIIVNDDTLVPYVVGEEWVRCSASGSVTPQNYRFMDINANAGTDIYVWGVQIEEGSFPTSYIPTTTTTVTRAADVAEITGTNFSSWYNQGAGTVFAEAKTVDSGINQHLLHVYGASASNNRGAYYLNSSNRPSAYWVNSGSNQALLESSTPVNGFEGASFKYVAAYDTDDFVLGYDGGNLIFDTSGTPDPTLYRASIGSYNASLAHLNGHISRLTYWPTRLSDSDLQRITT